MQDLGTGSSCRSRPPAAAVQWRRIGINIIEFIYRKLDSVDWEDTGLMFVARRLDWNYIGG